MQLSLLFPVCSLLDGYDRRPRPTLPLGLAAGASSEDVVDADS